MSWYTLFLLLVTCVSCKNPNVITAKGVEVEDTSTSYSMGHSDTESDEYLSKPMVHEIDVDGTDTTDPVNNDQPWLDWPDSTDRALFRSPAESTTDEETVDNETVDERHDYETS